MKNWRTTVIVVSVALSQLNGAICGLLAVSFLAACGNQNESRQDEFGNLSKQTTIPVASTNSRTQGQRSFASLTAVSNYYFTHGLIDEGNNAVDSILKLTRTMVGLYGRQAIIAARAEDYRTAASYLQTMYDNIPSVQSYKCEAVSGGVVIRSFAADGSPIGQSKTLNADAISRSISDLASMN